LKSARSNDSGRSRSCRRRRTLRPGAAGSAICCAPQGSPSGWPRARHVRIVAARIRTRAPLARCPLRRAWLRALAPGRRTVAYSPLPRLPYKMLCGATPPRDASGPWRSAPHAYAIAAHTEAPSAAGWCLTRPARGGPACGDAASTTSTLVHRRRRRLPRRPARLPRGESRVPRPRRFDPALVGDKRLSNVRRGRVSLVEVCGDWP
jgi:hypothetical protein